MQSNNQNSHRTRYNTLYQANSFVSSTQLAAPLKPAETQSSRKESGQGQLKKQRPASSSLLSYETQTFAQKQTTSLQSQKLAAPQSNLNKYQPVRTFGTELQNFQGLQPPPFAKQPSNGENKNPQSVQNTQLNQLPLYSQNQAAAPVLPKQKILRVKTLGSHTTTNAQSQRFFIKNHESGSSLVQKHRALHGGSQGLGMQQHPQAQNAQRESQDSAEHQSIQLPKSSAAPTHNQHLLQPHDCNNLKLAQHESLTQREKQSSSLSTQNTVLTNNFFLAQGVAAQQSGSSSNNNVPSLQHIKPLKKHNNSISTNFEVPVHSNAKLIPSTTRAAALANATHKGHSLSFVPETIEQSQSQLEQLGEQSSANVEMTDASNFGPNQIGEQSKTSAFHLADQINSSSYVEEKQADETDIKSRLRHFREVQAPQLTLEHTCDVDRADIGNTQQVAEFAAAICTHLLGSEEQFLPSPYYMSKQNDINEKMRAILVDWIIEVHLKFKLRPETLFLTISLIDRFLEKTKIMRTKLQLVGVTAMLIASKYEEIYAPEVRDFVFITDNAYTKEEIFAMEYSMLSVLEFSVTTPSAYSFLERFAKVANASPRLWNLARYLIELPLIEQRMLKYSPSNLAASAIYLALKIIYRGDGEWTPALTNHSGYSEHQLRACAKDMCILLAGIEKCSLQAVRKKFTLQRFMEVALIRIEH